MKDLYVGPKDDQHLKSPYCGKLGRLCAITSGLSATGNYSSLAGTMKSDLLQ